MKRQFCQKIVWILLLFAMIVPIRGFAEEEKTNDIGYFINIASSSFQRDKARPFFDLRVKPDTKTSVFVYINNTSNKEEEFNIQIHPARTNSNQVIVYDNKTENKEKPPADIMKLVKVEKANVPVKAKSSGKVKVDIDMQGEKFDGSLIAGITVTKVLKEEKAGYNNVFAYLKPIVLTENDKKITPELTFNEAKAISTFGYNQIAVNLSNKQAVAFDITKTEGKITSEKDNSTIEYKGESGQVAPNSSFDVLFHTKGKEPSGWYKLDLTLCAKNGKKWHFTERFEIKKVEEQYEQPQITRTLPETAKNYWWVIALCLLLITLIITFFLFRKKKKDTSNKNSDEMESMLMDMKKRKERRKQRRAE